MLPVTTTRGPENPPPCVVVTSSFAELLVAIVADGFARFACDAANILPLRLDRPGTYRPFEALSWGVEHVSLRLEVLDMSILLF